MISIATEFDVPALHVLVNSAYRGDSSRKGWTTEADLLSGQRVDPQMLRQMMHKPDSRIWTVWENQRILGCVHLTIQDSHLDKNKKCLYLGLLTVDPNQQNLGLGKKMLAWAETQTHLHHLTQIEMTVISQRTELIQWYVRKGFTETSTKIPFPTDPQFGLRKMDLELQVLYKKI